MTGDRETTKRGDATLAMPDDDTLCDLTDFFRTFGDTTRVRIMFLLANGPMSVGDISDGAGASQTTVSHHLRTLRQARLVKSERRGQRVVYSISDDHVMTILRKGLAHVCEG